jgi:hypothetical protein
MQSMKRMKALAAATAAAIGIAMLGCEETTSPAATNYSANLTAASEIPAPTGSPTATGTASLSLSADRILTVTVAVSGNLTSNVSMSHIHGPASTSGTAGIILDFVPSMTSVINAGTRTGTIVNTTYDLKTLAVSSTGVLRVTADSLIALLNNGNAYVNVHTTTNAAGEVRGQILK